MRTHGDKFKVLALTTLFTMVFSSCSKDLSLSLSDQLLKEYGNPYESNILDKTANPAENPSESANAKETFPLIKNEDFYMAMNGTISLDVLVNDKLKTDEEYTLSIETTALYGSVSITDEKIDYTPNLGFLGKDTVVYSLKDSSNQFFSGTVNIMVMDALTWSGLGSDSNWSSPMNWCGSVDHANSIYGQCTGGSAPGPGDIAQFNSSCLINCDAIIDQDISVAGLVMDNDFQGSLTQKIGKTLTISSAGIKLRSGSFIGGDQIIDINGPYEQSGGFFKSTSGALHIGYTSPSSSNNSKGFIKSGGEFIHNSGTLVFDGSLSTGGHSVKTATKVTLDKHLVVNNLVIKISDTSHYSGHNQAKIDLDPNFNIIAKGNLIFEDGEIWTGQIDVEKNVELRCQDGSLGKICAGGGITYADGRMGGGTGTIRLVGSSDSTYSHQAGSIFPTLVIDKASNFTEVTPKAGTTSLAVAKLKLLKGTFRAPSNTLSVGFYLGYAYSPSHAVDGFSVGVDGTFLHNNGTLEFNGQAKLGGHTIMTQTLIDVAENLDLNNLLLNVKDTGSYGSSYNHTKVTIASGDSLTVLGDFIAKDGEIWGGKINLKGDLSYHCEDGIHGVRCAGTGRAGTDGRSGGGTTEVWFNGSRDQTYAFQEGARTPPLFIDTAFEVTPKAGTTSLASAEFNLMSGTFVAPSGVMAIGYVARYNTSSNTDGLTVSGGIFNHSNGTLKLDGSVRTSHSRITTTIDVSGNLILNNLVIEAEDTFHYGGYNNADVKIANGNSLTLLGNFTVNDGRIMGGVIFLEGDMTLSKTNSSVLAEGGTTSIHFTGPEDQYITQAAGSFFPSGSIVVNNTTNDLILGTDLSLNNSQSMAVSSGNIELNSFDILGIGALTMSGGSVTQTNLSESISYTSCTGTPCAPF